MKIIFIIHFTFIPFVFTRFILILFASFHFSFSFSSLHFNLTLLFASCHSTFPFYSLQFVSIIRVKKTIRRWPRSSFNMEDRASGRSIEYGNSASLYCSEWSSHGAMTDRAREESIDTDPKSLGRVQLLLFSPCGNVLVSMLCNGHEFSRPRRAIYIKTGTDHSAAFYCCIMRIDLNSKQPTLES